MVLKNSIAKAVTIGIMCIIMQVLLNSSCSIDATNPLDSDYSGDYKLSAEWAWVPDTFHVLDKYQIKYFSTGLQTFSEYKIESEPDSVIDAEYALLSATDSTMDVYFTKQFAGTITFVGIRPNKKRNEVTLPITVINPFRILGNPRPLTGTSDTLQISRIPSPGMTVQWYMDNTVQEQATSDKLILSSDTVVTHTAFAVVGDTLGHFISTDTLDVSFQPRMPTVKFPLDSIQVPVGEETTISLQFSDCDSIRWVVKGLGISQTNTGALKTTFTSAGRDTIIATGISRHVPVGTPDTLYVTALVFAYSLQTVSYPDTIQAGQWATWQVRVTQDGTPVVGSQVSYEWKTTPDSVWDSTRSNSEGSQFQLYVDDSVASFVVSVKARIGTSDSTALRQQNIIVRAFRPMCTFVTQPFTTPINTDVTLAVRAMDSNTDGSIAGIFYFSTDYAAPVSTNGDTSWTMRFVTPGSKVLKAFAVDDDGFVSDTATLLVTVTANVPYFANPFIDTSVFINDSVSIVMQAQSGNSGDTIVSYMWDFNADGTWDKTTSTGRLDTVYTTPGIDSILVGCQNQRGDSAETLGVVVIRVNAGLPMMQSLSVSPPVTYANGHVSLSVTASDTNGTVNKIAVRINNGADSIFTVVPSQSIDTSFTFTMSTPGKYLFSAAAIDDDDGKSAYISIGDSVVVTQGEPVVTGVAPESTWVVDTTVYKISAFDLNGTVSSYFVKWENGGSYEQFSDSTVTHSYTTDGGKRLSIYVVDNDGNSSDTISDSVYVKLGKPTATPVMADSVWIFDDISYKVRGTDPNDHVVQWAVSWATGLAFEVQTDSNFTHAYATEGLKNARAWVKDNDGISSDTVAHDIYVKLGEPLVTSISLSVPLNSVYVLDDIDFTIKGTDPNDGIDSIMISWDGDETYEVRRKATGDSVRFDNYQFARADSGVNTIRVMVKDVDGLTKDSSLSVTVLSGAAIIDSITPHSNIWVRDLTNYSVHAHDNNGTVDSFVVDWDNDGTWDLFSNSGNVSWAFDTSLYGSRTVKVKVHDDDTVWTEKSMTIDVRLGRPVVSGKSFGDSIQWVPATGGGLDTMFFRWISGQPTTVRVDTTDTNGQCVRYYWDWEEGYLVDAVTSIPKVQNNMPENVVHKITVSAKDDDSLRSAPIQFYVFPDESPPTPSFNVWYSGSGSTIEVRLDTTWFDVKDRQNTEVLIEGGPIVSTVFTVRDTLLLWQEASTLTAYNDKRVYSFDKSGYETEYGSKIYLRVSYRDKRSSVTVQPTTFTY